MKNIIKMSLVALGIVSATIVSSSSLLAKQAPVADGGHCDSRVDEVCGTTAGGFTAKGYFITN
ncbi:hypothetical protein [Epilithonimonas hispanica]|uniref:Uncharacterized protein n=1 Tax=Epilithonimonas hispanica TaxID=358687 RepID=A0A3D9CZI2_9FLAO|nr:hypothetical protein [Epilithonimonas hispanica]REC71173.1 hypothetical protein DRF58_06475 [Epilithonimonas hispanica]